MAVWVNRDDGRADHGPTIGGSISTDAWRLRWKFVFFTQRADRLAGGLRSIDSSRPSYMRNLRRGRIDLLVSRACHKTRRLGLIVPRYAIRFLDGPDWFTSPWVVD